MALFSNLSADAFRWAPQRTRAVADPAATAGAAAGALPGSGGWKEGNKGWGAIANELLPFLAANYAAPSPFFGPRSWSPQGIHLPYLLGQGWGTPQGFGGGLLGGQNFSQLGLTPWWGQW